MKIVVVKLGGHALDAPENFSSALDMLAQDVIDVRAGGYEVILVHGAGPQISTLLDRLGVASHFVDGLRVTDAETLDVVAMSLALVNLRLVAGLCVRGIRAEGLAGPDQSAIRANLLSGELGYVGGAISVSPSVILERVGRGCVPVVSPLAVDADGHFLNCNADAVAGAVASATGASALVLLTSVDQIRTNPLDPATSLATVSRSDVSRMVRTGVIVDGMIPKVASAIQALDAGANTVVIANGTRPHALSNAVAGTGAYTEVTQ